MSCSTVRTATPVVQAGNTSTSSLVPTTENQSNSSNKDQSQRFYSTVFLSRSCTAGRAPASACLVTLKHCWGGGGGGGGRHKRRRDFASERAASVAFVAGKLSEDEQRGLTRERKKTIIMQDSKEDTETPRAGGRGGGGWAQTLFYS